MEDPGIRCGSSMPACIIMRQKCVVSCCFVPAMLVSERTVSWLSQKTLKFHDAKNMWIIVNRPSEILWDCVRSCESENNTKHTLMIFDVNLDAWLPHMLARTSETCQRNDCLRSACIRTDIWLCLWHMRHQLNNSLDTKHTLNIFAQTFAGGVNSGHILSYFVMPFWRIPVIKRLGKMPHKLMEVDVFATPKFFLGIGFPRNSHARNGTWSSALSATWDHPERTCSPCRPCLQFMHFDKTLHKLLQGCTMMYSECVNGTRSNVFPLSFHVFDINSTRTASASSSLRAFGPITPLGLWHPRRLRWKRSVPWDWLSTGREELWFSTHGKNMLWNWGSCCQRLDELVLTIA